MPSFATSTTAPGVAPLAIASLVIESMAYNFTGSNPELLASALDKKNGALTIQQAQKEKICRNPDDIKLIVLHETGGENNNAPSSPNSVHLMIRNDTSVVQFADLVQLCNQAKSFNNYSFGIEFVNNPYSNEEGDNNISIKWYINNQQPNWYYKVPSIEMLESLVSILIQILEIEKESSLNIDKEWPQLMPHPDPKKTKDYPNLFLMSSPYTALPNFFSDNIKKFSGIYAHGVLYRPGGHADGFFQSLYTWLRIGIGLDKETAYTKSKLIAQQDTINYKHIYPNGSNNVLCFLDVSDVIK